MRDLLPRTAWLGRMGGNQNRAQEKGKRRCERSCGGSATGAVPRLLEVTAGCRLREEPKTPPSLALSKFGISGGKDEGCPRVSGGVQLIKPSSGTEAWEPSHGAAHKQNKCSAPRHGQG